MTVPLLRLAVAMFVVRTPSLIVVDGVAEGQIAAAADVAAINLRPLPKIENAYDKGRRHFSLPLL
jgi:hypothetical protein